MNIKLLTAASKDYWDVLKLSAPNKLEYCLKWNIELTIREHFNKDIKHERTYFMQNALKECDWLWFMGSDTLIMNHTIDVRQYLDNDVNFIIGKDINGINNDVFFLKNTPSSREFLDNVQKYNKTEENDQESMKKAINDTLYFKTKIVHQKQFNSYLYDQYSYPDDKGGNFSIGDFVLHLPGLPNKKRQVLMREYLPKVIK